MPLRRPPGRLWLGLVGVRHGGQGDLDRWELLPEPVQDGHRERGDELIGIPRRVDGQTGGFMQTVSVLL
jgi:hypothetical protein